MYCGQVAALRALGFDHVFNYKTTSTDAALGEAAPDGIDIYFEVRVLKVAGIGHVQ
jgi:NADPH-dependent curcumin reductase CurA